MWRLLFLVSSVLVGSAAAQPASFEGIGQLNPSPPFGSLARNVSGDGQVIVASAIAAGSGYTAARWTASGGLQSLGTPPAWGTSVAWSASADGSCIVGEAGSYPGTTAFRWSEQSGVVNLGHLSGGAGPSAHALDVSDDGNIVVGYDRFSGSSMYWAFRWTPEQGMQPLPLSGPQVSSATAISSDGSTIAGHVTLPRWLYHGFVWTQATGMVLLPPNTVPAAISDDGSVIVGLYEACAAAFRWTQAGGLQCLGTPPGTSHSRARRVSGDGSVIVGVSVGAGFVSHAFIWDQANGSRLLADVLQTQHAVHLAGWHLQEANGISSDGSVIVGAGRNPCGESEGWVVRLGTKPACYADCNADGSLTIADFGCFQSRFVMQDRYADCAGDCEFTAADFSCFQGRFAAGCP